MQPIRAAQHRAAIILAGCLIVALSPGVPAKAGEKVIYAFQGGTDGRDAFGSLIADSAGNLFSTTSSGGDGTCQCGTVFKAAPGGSESVLYRFVGGNDGAFPFAGLVLDRAGNLYGTTAAGGGSGNCNGGCGTVFKIGPTEMESILYRFQGSDGSGPQGNLMLDSKGDLFGTTAGGGALNCNDGSGCGTVFKLKPGGTIVTLYTFLGGADGSTPLAGLIHDSNGNLYGTTVEGGNLAQCAGIGCGVVFKIAPDGTETVLYVFQGGTDGAGPRSSLISDSAANLYGTTDGGGSCSISQTGCGTVFRLASDGTETILHAFQGGSDGLAPTAGVIMDKSGNLYGTTYFGGGTGCKQTGHIGCGTVFKLAPDGTESVLATFGGKRGTYPATSLLLKHGVLYGAASAGGANKDGVVFSVKP